jgi:hypothetical protein
MFKMKKYPALLLFTTFILLLTFSCIEKMEETPGVLNKTILLSHNLYSQTDTKNYNIKTATVVGDSLFVEITASGCSGNSWKITLIDSEEVAESNPIQRFMKISLENTELCMAIFTKKVSFDLKPIRVSGEKSVCINLDNWVLPLVYTY